MFKSAFIFPLIFSFLFFASLPCPAQEEEEIPTPATASIEEAVAGFEKALEAKDRNQIQDAGEELSKWMKQKKIKDGEKKKIVACVEKAFRMNDKEDPKNELRGVAAYALAKLDRKYATPAFLKLFRKRDIKDNLPLKLHLIGAMGEMADESSKAVKHMCSLLKDKDFQVIGKTAAALSGYKGANQRVRKTLVKELINSLEGAVNQAKDPRNTTAVRKVNTIQLPVLQSLQELTGERVGGIEQWRRWYNKNKKKKW